MLFEVKIRSFGILLGFAAATFIHASAGMAGDSETTASELEIRLRPVTKVIHPNVRLTDIATFFLDGRICTLIDLPRPLQVQLHQVQVVRLTHQRHAVTVARADIQTRIQRMRSLSQPCKIIGPAFISVAIRQPNVSIPSDSPFRFASSTVLVDPATEPDRRAPEVITDLSLERAIQDELARQFGMSSDDLQVRLLQNVVKKSQSLQDIQRPQIQVTANGQFPYGRSSLMVRILDGERIAMMQSVTVDVRLRQTMLMARRPIATGTKIDESMIKQEIRFTDRQSEQLSSEDVVGMIAGRSFRANEILSWNSLKDASTVTTIQSRPLVNAREAVQVIARKNGMTIVIPSAEALQSGRKGQLIRVRNLRSNKVITARVVGAGSVELVL